MHAQPFTDCSPYSLLTLRAFSEVVPVVQPLVANHDPWSMVEHLEADGTQELLITGLGTLLRTGIAYIRPRKDTTSRVISPVISSDEVPWASSSCGHRPHPRVQQALGLLLHGVQLLSSQVLVGEQILG